MLLPGYSARLLYRLGLIRTDAGFAQTLAQARVDDAAGSDPHASDFSQRVRGLPS